LDDDFWSKKTEYNNEFWQSNQPNQKQLKTLFFGAKSNTPTPKVFATVIALIYLYHNLFF